MLVPTNYNEDASLTLWLDPRGHFLIYSAPEYKRGTLDLLDVLLFQALDTTGHPSGPATPIVDRASYFDLLED